MACTDKFGSYYDYVTNKCYKDKGFTKLAGYYRPLNTTGVFVVAGGSGKSWQMNCMNGMIVTPIGNPSYAMCSCNLMWLSSKKYDMNGFPFYCDVAVDDPGSYFP